MTNQAENVKSVETRYEAGTPWKNRGIRTKIAFCFAMAWAVYIVLTMFKVFFYLGIPILPMAHRSMSCAMLIAVCLIGTPARKPRNYNTLPWYDVVLVL